MENIKFKPLNIEQIMISVDRLTRFKDPETKYLRVFKDIICSHLISPKYKKTDLDNFDYTKLRDIAEFIINESIKNLDCNDASDSLINQRLLDYENNIFILSEETEALLKNRINYKAIIKLLGEDDLPINLKWLKLLQVSSNPRIESHMNGYRFPITKLIICEGITEEILLPEFARLLDYDFDKNGIHIISAGGKNQVVKTFYKFAGILKIPIFVLLDNDAKENYNEILPKLRENDKIHIIKQGEFEDILPLALVEKTLKYVIENISFPETLDNSHGMVNFLEEFFRHRGAHEFKKADFAHAVKENISSIEDVSDEFREIIKELKTIPCLTN